MVIFSGDGDFRRLVEAVQRRGRRVSVVSTIRTSPPMVADELRRQADNFIELDDLKSQIAREGGRRPPQPSRRLKPGQARAAVSSGDMEAPAQPPHDCPLCPRLKAFRVTPIASNIPDWFNGPVPSFGPLDARILIAGLAPGLQGANRTGRPFTGDWAGDLLYATLLKYWAGEGVYDERADDTLELVELPHRQCGALRAAPRTSPSPARSRPAVRS